MTQLQHLHKFMVSLLQLCITGSRLTCWQLGVLFVALGQQQQQQERQHPTDIMS
jgi:hypothetical protein